MVKRGKGYGLTKKGILNKLERERAVKDPFEKKVVGEIFPMGLPVSRGHVLQSTCALIPSCSDPTSNGQVSVLKCHPWIGMLTHTVLEDL